MTQQVIHLLTVSCASCRGSGIYLSPIVKNHSQRQDWRHSQSVGRGNEQQSIKGRRPLFGARKDIVERRSVARQKRQQQQIDRYWQELGAVRDRELALLKLEVELFEICRYGSDRLRHPTDKVAKLARDIEQKADLIEGLVADHRALLVATGIDPQREFPILIRDLRSSARRLAEAAQVSDPRQRARLVSDDGQTYKQAVAPRASELRVCIVTYIERQIRADRIAVEASRPFTL